MNHETDAVPRVLLVEDDPVSGAFLREAIAGFPATVDVAASCAEARQLAGANSYDLLLFDAHLPDGTGTELLDSLRASGIDTRALAHTAGLDEVRRRELIARGFLDVLPKPLGVGAVHEGLARHLRPVLHADWNDAIALSALGGEITHVEALRRLFLAELPTQQSRVRAAAAAGDAKALRAELHRLTASCGFVGAARLAAAVERLQAAPVDAGALRDVEQAIDALLAVQRG